MARPRGSAAWESTSEYSRAVMSRREGGGLGRGGDGEERRGRGERGDRARHPPHRISDGPGEARGAGHDRRGVDAEPLLEQRAVERPEVRGRAQVAEVVELGQAGEFAEHLGAYARTEQQPDPRRAVVGPGAVLLGPAAELRPHVDEDAIAQAAGVEVALEGGQRVEGQPDLVGQAGGLVGVGVVVARGGEGDAAQRQPAAEHRGQGGQALGERVVGGG